MNEFKRMQELAGLLTEVRIVPANYTQLSQPVPHNAGIYKVNNFPSPKTDNPMGEPDIYKIINQIVNFSYGEDIDDDLDLDDMNVGINNLKSFTTVYVYPASDGQISFHNSFDEFSEGYKTEEDWGIEDWKQVMQ
jgi:hypothetical protein